MIRNSRPLLYVTQDGLLEPLTFSQVVRVLKRLAGLGWSYRVLSLEKQKDLADEQRVRWLRDHLRESGIDWEFRHFDEAQSIRSASNNLGWLTNRTVALATQGAIAGVHARSYVPAVAALAAWYACGIRWVFDARGYWIDERLEEGRWFSSPIRLGIARGLESQLFTTSSAVVTLTELQATDVSTRFGSRDVRCVTTLADYEDFRSRSVAEIQRVPSDVVTRLRSRRVISVIGSINRSYLVDETLDLARRILAADPRTHLLVLSGQREAFASRLEALRVPRERYEIQRSPHDAMPEWLALVEWCLLLLHPNSPAKRASMPTKLAELFAAGVRPVQFGCNIEVRDWVLKAKSGIVLDDVAPESLEFAARRIANAEPLSSQATEFARDVTATHFSLDAGVQKYDALLSKVFGH